MPPQTKQEAFEKMTRIAQLIEDGAITFIKKEYAYLGIFCLAFSVLIYLAVDFPVSAGLSSSYMPFTTMAFYIGAGTSMLCGYIGMRIAVYTNVRTTWSCCKSIGDGFHVAFKGGEVLGFTLVSIAIIVLQILIIWYRAVILPKSIN